MHSAFYQYSNVMKGRGGFCQKINQYTYIEIKKLSFFQLCLVSYFLEWIFIFVFYEREVFG